jgi:hypothetical protein
MALYNIANSFAYKIPLVFRKKIKSLRPRLLVRFLQVRREFSRPIPQSRNTPDSPFTSLGFPSFSPAHPEKSPRKPQTPRVFSHSTLPSCVGEERSKRLPAETEATATTRDGGVVADLEKPSTDAANRQGGSFPPVSRAPTSSPLSFLPRVSLPPPSSNCRRRVGDPALCVQRRPDPLPSSSGESDGCIAFSNPTQHEAARNREIYSFSCTLHQDTVGPATATLPSCSRSAPGIS